MFDDDDDYEEKFTEKKSCGYWHCVTAFVRGIILFVCESFSYRTFIIL